MHFSYRLTITFLLLTLFLEYSISHTNTESSDAIKGLSQEQQEKLNLELLFAVIDGNKEAIKRLIRDGADVKIRDNFGNTLLHYTGNSKVTKVLIEAEVNVNARNNLGNTPLHDNSMGSNKTGKVLALIKAEADVNIINSFGKTPLGYNHSVKAYRHLIEAGALTADDVSIINSFGKTPLNYGHPHPVDAYRHLIKEGFLTADDLHRQEGQSELNLELLFAVISWDTQAIRRLINDGANIHVRDNLGNTLLHYLASSPPPKHTRSDMFRLQSIMDIINILITSGADINARNNLGKTPKDMSSRFYTVKRTSRYSRTLKTVSVKNVHIESIFKKVGALTADELLQQELNLKLLFAVIDSDVEAVKSLITDGADINIRDNFSNTLLHYAKTERITNTLIEAEADIDAINNLGNTPLHDDSIGRYGRALALIKAGANVSAKNNAGKAPIDYHHTIGAYQHLIKAGALVNSVCVYFLL